MERVSDGHGAAAGAGLANYLGGGVATKAASKDKVALELDRLNMQIGQPSVTVGKRKLDAQEYDRYQRLAGESLHKTLSRLVGTRGWERMSDDSRRDLIEKLIAQSRAAARARLH